MKTIIVAGVDPALSNLGLSKFMLDLETLDLTLLSIKLVSTQRRVNKQVRQNSDDLRRCQEIYGEFKSWVSDCVVTFGEVPTGAQSARAALSFGMTTMLLAASPIPVIQVQPFETKLATVGTKTASKEEMIEWAGELYPSAAWLRYDRATKNHAKGDLHEDNEHMADACAVCHAGIRTDEFRRLMAFWKASAKAA